MDVKFEARFAREFLDIYTGCDEEVQDYQNPQYSRVNLTDEQWKYYWRMTDKNDFRRLHDLGFCNDIEIYGYTFSHQQSLIWDDDDYMKGFHKSKYSALGRIMKKIDSRFSMEDAFYGVYNDIMKTWYDIVQEVRNTILSRPIANLIRERWFSYDVRENSIEYEIRDMISNCLNDPDVYFMKKENDNQGIPYIIRMYKKVPGMTREPEYDSGGCLVKTEVDMPEEAVDIFWNELMYEPYQGADVFKKHYVLLAHAMEYDQYGSVEFLHNLFTMIEMKEVDARFKEALFEMSKKDITCIGCREEQPNQEAHMGEGGCIQE